MGTSRDKLGNRMRTAIIAAACFAILAMTSGLLLALHVSSTKEHPAEPDSHNCPLCRHLLVLSKKLLLNPNIELIYPVHVARADRPQPPGHVQDHCPSTSLARAPPHTS